MNVRKPISVAAWAIGLIAIGYGAVLWHRAAFGEVVADRYRTAAGGYVCVAVGLICTAAASALRRRRR